MDCQAPIIVIGAGRSGTTLLKRILDAHPAISFAGETKFLTARLWLEAWGDRFWYSRVRYNETEPASSRGTMPDIPVEVIEREQSRCDWIGSGIGCDGLRLELQKRSVERSGGDRHARRLGRRRLYNFGNGNLIAFFPAAGSLAIHGQAVIFLDGQLGT